MKDIMIHMWFIKMFRALTPAELAAHDLAVAELSKLNAESVREHADSIIAREAARIKRLTKFLAELSKKPSGDAVSSLL
jgi:hypothetical protein